eukprot:5623227-Amphidinium_carterae.1
MMLHSQTIVSWTYESSPGCPASHLDVIRDTSFATSGEQKPRASTGCTREALCTSRWKRQRSHNETCINAKPPGKRLVSQPQDILVCSWHVACVRTLVCRTLAAALPKRPDLRQSCPGAWILPLDIS